LSIVRELGPVLTAIVVAARSGSAIAAEIGTMKVTEQLDALRALATDPIEYLVVPRYLASLITLPLLTIMADVCGTMGGFVVAVGAGVSREIYLKSVLRLVKADHLLTGLVKAVVFGTLISIVGCQQGFRTGQGAAAVGRATTNSVVLCVVLVHIADYFLALIFG
ncbi:MAG TPA: ABC transporter permease, partial [Armatimonadetes bacterium]|nr:ABC transporter permease [Armatimonadota bacterium]